MCEQWRKAIVVWTMLKAQLIFFLSLAILGEKISGAQSLETIDFKS